jgi:hypothetical protein
MPFEPHFTPYLPLEYITSLPASERKINEMVSTLEKPWSILPSAHPNRGRGIIEDNIPRYTSDEKIDELQEEGIKTTKPMGQLFHSNAMIQNDLETYGVLKQWTAAVKDKFVMVEVRADSPGLSTRVPQIV